LIAESKLTDGSSWLRFGPQHYHYRQSLHTPFA
jgi:hypothetical protein